MGRRSKLTDDVRRRITDAVLIGASRACAAGAAGIGESTFYRWLERGEASSKGPFREFWEAVSEAECQAELAAVRCWQAAMANDWRAAMHFLERRFPERWGPKQPGLDAQHRPNVTVLHYGQVSREEWEKMAQRVAPQRSPSEES